MNWIEGLPRESGYYWFWYKSETESQPEIVEVDIGDPSMMGIWTCGSELKMYAESITDCIFYGPILPPI
jgi:hypothetical protein